eukprot:TRINITY_DN3319_c0_g1_i1.p1 TRINITY_DN3319_c0_g1~~TRINITY_DN3319_c0_g1_i1.p1  ORF type:complete len:737 (-),score=231.40 TRINITY_DN3319_c0_g1_i1:80-2290(-)
MGRGLKDPKNRRKGPPGTGRARKREKTIRERAAKDRAQLLTEFQEKQKKRLAHAARTGADGGGQAHDASAGKKVGSQSTGFAKAMIAQGPVVAVPFKRHFWQAEAPPPGEPEMSLKLLRKDLGVRVKGAPTPPPVMTFTAKGLPQTFEQFLHWRGSAQKKGAAKIVKPTPIQAQVWPAVLCGLDVIAISPTGSGKTLAYLLPAVPHMLARQQEAAAGGKAIEGPLCLVLAPTRELAKQVSDVCGGSVNSGWLRRLHSLKAGAVYGGLGKEEQLDAIVTGGAPHVLSATPGRLLDLVGLGVLNMEQVSYLVLDEADRMLALGFEPQLTAIMSAIRPNRQALCFSATFPGKLREAAEKWMGDDLVTIRVSAVEMKEGKAKDEDDEAAGGDAAAKGGEGEEAAAEGGADGEAGGLSKSAKAFHAGPTSLTMSSTIRQTVHTCAEHKKPRKLLKFIDKVRNAEKAAGVRQRSAILIFCTQIKTLKVVASLLDKHGEKCAPLHSGIPQAKREQALSQLKAGQLNTLVATDVAARGLHITRLKYVINYDFPTNLEQYCHRIGRVGRNGAEGFAYSFFTRNLKDLAPGLIALLERTGQHVDPFLRELVDGPVKGKKRKREESNADDTESSEEAAVEEKKAGGLGAAVGEAAEAGQDDEDDDDDASVEPLVGGKGGGIRIKLTKRAADDSDDSDEEAPPAEGGVAGAMPASGAPVESETKKLKKPPRLSKKKRKAAANAKQAAK